MSADELLSEEQLGATAFDLLASSTLTRFELVAREHGRRADLAARLRDEKDLKAAVDRARRLWMVVAQQAERGLEEIELAVLLAALAAADVVTPAHAMIEEIAGAAGSARSAWVPGLARLLLARQR